VSGAKVFLPAILKHLHRESSKSASSCRFTDSRPACDNVRPRFVQQVYSGWKHLIGCPFPCGVNFWQVAMVITPFPPWQRNVKRNCRFFSSYVTLCAWEQGTVVCPSTHIRQPRGYFSKDPSPGTARCFVV
jgi:hypothetical protein